MHHYIADCGIEELELRELKQQAMTSACGDLKPAELGEIQLQNGDEPAQRRRFQFVYLGFSVVDRRYTQSMLPWVISEIRQRKERQEIRLSVESTTVKALNVADGSAAFHHHVQTIIRCARSMDKKCFAYLVKSSNSTCSCFCYAFEAMDTFSVPGFIHCIREAGKGNCDFKDKRKVSTSDPGNPVAVYTEDLTQHIMVTYPLWYVGKVVVSHRQAPPTLIDDSVDRFKTLNRRKELEKELKQNCRNPKTSSPKFIHQQLPPELVKQTLHKTAHKAASLDEGKMLGDCETSILETVNTNDNQLSQNNIIRPRSASDGDKKLFNFPAKERCDSDYNSRNTHVRSANGQAQTDNRNVVLQISSVNVSVVSTATNTILMEKKLREISFCQQGTKNPEHFGFICREQRSSQYVCYVFKGDTEPLVDSIMRSLKQAFHAAWQATGSTTVCELCPLHHLHQLCTQLEGLPVNQQHEVLKKHLVSLTEVEMNEFTDKYKAETQGGDVVELGEDVDMIMAILRSLFEKRQQSHVHSTLVQVPVKDNMKTGNLLQKAKKSLANSFESFRIKRGRSRTTLKQDSLDDSERFSSDEITKSLPGRMRSITIDNSAPTPPLSPISPHPKLQRVGQISRNKSSESLPDEACGSSSSPPHTPTKHVAQMHKTLSRQHSYRQVIFHSVVTPTKRTSSSHAWDTELTWSEMTGRKRSSQELRALWRKAIMEQVLLNRMEKENKTLDDILKSNELKRLKLSYSEGSPCPQSAITKWEQLLAAPWDMKVEQNVLKDAVKAGVPKDRRGEVWQFLAKQYSLRSPASKDASWKAGSYDTMRDGTCSQQHSIFIDLGRTFPSHLYFMSQYGPGQLSLFNLLKAYSVLDTEVGYCQGLSFVAGVLLMHTEEHQAFEVMRHLLFALNLRKLYKSDMQELQIQFYMLSRLLHDYHSPLYEFLEELDITPTLYAAAWFLTLFSSQFPVGFVARVMDMIFFEGMEVVFKVMLLLLTRCKEGIMACDGFECAVEYIKTALPPYAFEHMDSVVAQVLDMNITKQLESYEIEYNVFREEDLSLASLEEFELERSRKLEAENMVLGKHLQEVSEQVSCSRNTIHSLEGTIHTMQINQAELLSLIRTLKTDNESLKKLGGAQAETRKTAGAGTRVDSRVVGGCNSTEGTDAPLSPREQSDKTDTDSFEYIGSNDLTDDEADSLARDSPADELSELRTGTRSPLLSDKAEDLTVSR